MSALTLTEKILAAHTDTTDRVAPGDVVWVTADRLLTHDVCGPPVFDIFRREFGPDARVWDPEGLLLIPDHYIFTADADARANVEAVRRFAAEQAIPHFYDAGGPEYHGVCHVALAEERLVRPGEVLFGTDSHTCTAGAFGAFATGIGNTDAAFVLGTGQLWVRVPATIRVVLDGALPAHLMAKDLILEVIGRLGVDGATYRTLEFTGPVTAGLSPTERMTLCNMAIEAGAKTGIIAPDDACAAHLGLPAGAAADWSSDPDARVESELRLDAAALAPCVARPHSPGNVVPVAEVAGTAVDRCYLGSCTGGKTEDLARAAALLAGREVRVDTCVVPATTAVDRDLDRETIDGRTLREIFEAAGARCGPPSCGACLGGPPDTFGRLGPGQTCISTTNRNFPGRMGAPDSAVFLASPLTVAATALTGRIADPRDWME